MKKKIVLLIVCITMIVAMPALLGGFGENVYAAGDCNGVETNLIDCGGEEPVCHVMNTVAMVMSVGVGVLAVIGIVITGIQYLTSGGNEEKARKSKRRMMELVIGLVLFAGLSAIMIWLNPGGLFCEVDTGVVVDEADRACGFEDVKKDEASKIDDAICWAQGKRIANGVSESRFAPNRRLKRYEGATFAARYDNPNNLSNYKCEGGCTNFENEIKGVSGEEYKNALAWATSNGIMVGNDKSRLDPGGGLTARDFATMACRVKNKGDKDCYKKAWTGIEGNMKGVSAGTIINRGQAMLIICLVDGDDCK